MNATQCKMARVATGLGIRDLANLAGISANTISRLERGEELKPSTIEAIRTTLESAGVIFVDRNGEGEGVRMKKLRAGDHVQLVKGTSTWGENLDLRGKIGLVVREVDDGTSLHRITVSFENEERFIGMYADLFEYVSKPGVRLKNPKMDNQIPKLRDRVAAQFDKIKNSKSLDEKEKAYLERMTMQYSLNDGWSASEQRRYISLAAGFLCD